MNRVYIGWDPDEQDAVRVATASLRRHATAPVDIRWISRHHLAHQLYTRATSVRDGRAWDDISQAPMSTAHAIARFFIPQIDDCPWVLFVDGDVLFRADIQQLFALADHQFAVMAVPHHYEPAAAVKKGVHVQTAYPRKNWSSVLLWNLSHPSHQRLTLDLLNLLPGRDLHRFCWLPDHEIGFLPEAWNWLSGHSNPDIDPALVHFTEGLPGIGPPQTYDAEWRSYLD
jgi:lipopolysaccharide biosynthesis glycosyltransferase